jgi:hypothetical protein
MGDDSIKLRLQVPQKALSMPTAPVCFPAIDEIKRSFVYRVGLSVQNGVCVRNAFRIILQKRVRSEFAIQRVYLNGCSAVND